MELQNLNNALDALFGPFEDKRKTEIIEAVKKDINKMTKSGSKDDSETILAIYNETFGRRNRVISKHILSKYKEILRHFTIDELRIAMENAKESELHKEKDHIYCTIEYFSRIDQVDKWLNIAPNKKPGTFNMPSMNVKG